ncbi:MAG: hypothetical protein LBN27_00095 [Prevotellaceae bacterium]|jgi:predicted dithiol-disulfide oxidoreductase (DUF899 family)|nr:hypothetical protein [Prevotellaceae bacterium]
MTTTDSKITGLIKKFHTLCSRIGIGNDAKELLLIDNFGVSSSRDLSVGQLVMICDHLGASTSLSDRDLELDKLRKRLIASVFAWGKSMGLSFDMVKVKKIAARAAKRTDFNDIPKEQLRSLYAAFNKKKKDLSTVEYFTADMIEYLSTYN